MKTKYKTYRIGQRFRMDGKLHDGQGCTDFPRLTDAVRDLKWHRQNYPTSTFFLEIVHHRVERTGL